MLPGPYPQNSPFSSTGFQWQTWNKPMNIALNKLFNEILGGILFIEGPNLWSLEAGCLVCPVEKYAIFAWKWYNTVWLQCHYDVRVKDADLWFWLRTTWLSALYPGRPGRKPLHLIHTRLLHDFKLWVRNRLFLATPVKSWQIQKHKYKHYQTLANTRSPGLNATLLALMLACFWNLWNLMT